MTQALAIDIGSSSVRAACYDVQGRELDGAACGVPYQLDVRADGSATVDARVLAAHVATALDGALAGGAVPDVVGVSCFWHSLVGVDDAGAPATEVLTWADTRANASAHALAAMVDAAAAHARTGAPVHASFWPAKLHYLANGRADAFVRVARWMSFAEYLYLQLFGVPACSTSMASATGMYDSAEGRWDVALAEAAGVDVAADRALAAGLRADAALAVERLREDPRDRGLAHAAGAGEQEGVVDAAAVERVRQRAHHVLLPDQLGEAFRAPLAGENLVAHGRTNGDEHAL